MSKNNLHQAIRKEQIEKANADQLAKETLENCKCSIVETRNEIQRGTDYVSELKAQLESDPENAELLEKLSTASTVLEQNQSKLEGLEDELVELESQEG